MNSSYDCDKQHRKSRLHAIERIKLTLDPDSFSEIRSNMSNYIFNDNSEKYAYDGVITGYGTICGELVFIYSQDVTIKGGTLGRNHGYKIANIIERAIQAKAPVIGIHDSGGARIQEGVHALSGYGEVFYYNTLASGYIPQISIIAGACAGGAVYSPGISDFIFVIEEVSRAFVTGPDVIKCVTGQDFGFEKLGGAKIHAEKSGVAHFYAKNEKECYGQVRKLINLLVQRNLPLKYNINNVLLKKNQEMINDILPHEHKKSYDVKKIINIILDTDSFLEVSSFFAKNIVIGLGRLNGLTVGIVANQPNHLAGAIDIDASDKAARFVRFCDGQDIPIITLVDTSGFLPNINQEHNGIIRHGAKLLYAYAEATTIKITIIMRKAYGGAYIAMGSQHLRSDFVYAWPDSIIDVMGAESAVTIINKNRISHLPANEQIRILSEKSLEYKNLYSNNKRAVEAGYVDEIILPEHTRKKLIYDIFSLKSKKSYMKIDKKHGNIPL